MSNIVILIALNILSKFPEEKTVPWSHKLTPREINFVNPLPVVLSKIS